MPVLIWLQMTNSQWVSITFGPSSLCNVVDKIFSKTLAPRLKVLLHNIVIREINYEHCVYYFGAIHTVESRPKCRRSGMIVKLDMNKDYDCIDWSFFESYSLYRFPC